MDVIIYVATVIFQKLIPGNNFRIRSHFGPNNMLPIPTPMKVPTDKRPHSSLRDGDGEANLKHPHPPTGAPLKTPL